MIKGADAQQEKQAKMLHLERRKQLRLLSLCAVIIFCHTGTSYLEEELFKHLEFKSPFVMVLVMCVLYSVLFTIWKQGFSADKTMLPPKVFGPGSDRSLQIALAFLCIAYGMANSLTKLSLQFVSVPTQIVFKSCKLVAVMLGSTVILKKSYSVAEYLIALGLVAGMVSFALADMKGSAMSSLKEADMSTVIGLSILLLALCFDSILGNLQEKFQKGKICDENVLMYVQSVTSAVLITVYTLFSGELVRGLTHCWNDVRVFFSLSIWGLLNIVGTIALLKVAGEFSAVTAVLTAFIRKFSSLIFSYFLFPKPFNIGHGLGLVLVFSSVAMHAMHKQKHKAAANSSSSNAPSEPRSLSISTKYLGGEKATDEEMGVLMHEPMHGAQPHGNGYAWTNGTGQSHVTPPSPQRSPQTHHTPSSPSLRAMPARQGA